MGFVVVGGGLTIGMLAGSGERGLGAEAEQLPDHGAC